MTDQSKPKKELPDPWADWNKDKIRPKIDPWAGFFTEEEKQKIQSKIDPWAGFFAETKTVIPRLIGTKDGKDIWELPSGDTFLREKGQSPGIPWDKLDYETQLNDMRSLTIWGKTGTSAGDAWPEHLIRAAKRIVGNSPDVTPEHIEKFIQYMRETGSMSYMQTHPGKPAYTPETEEMKKPNVWAEWGGFGQAPKPELKVVKVQEEEEYRKARQAAKREQLKGGALKGLERTAGFLESPLPLLTGMTSFIPSMAGAALSSLYKHWKEGFREIETPDPSVLVPQLLGKGEKTQEKIAEAMTYKPQTEFGQYASRVIGVPFEAYGIAREYLSEKASEDPEIQAGFRWLVDFAFLLGIPIGKEFMAKAERGIGEFADYVKDFTRKKKDILPENKKAIETITDQIKKTAESRKQYPFFPKDAPQIWYDVMDVTSGKGIRPFKDAAGKFIEYEEYKSNVPKQLRKKQGLPPDEVADMLGLEDSQALYRELQGKRVTEVEIPEWKIKAEAEEFAIQEPIMKTEAEILRKTGKPQDQIAEFLDNTFMDGERLRSVANDVVRGKRTLDDAVSEIGDLIESTVRPAREIAPARPEGAVPGGTLAYGMELPKYAKSINLERIGADYEAKKFILDMAEIYDKEIQTGRRGKITFEETKELADSISDRLSVDELREKIKSKTEKLDGYLQASRDVLNTSAVKTVELSRQYRVNPTEENLARFHHSMERHAAIQADVSSGATEVGRALSAHRIMSRTKDWLITKNYKAILKAMGKKKITEEIAKRISTLDIEDPVQVNKFIREATPARFIDKIYEVWNNFLVSGPVTHIKNIVSNTMTALEKPVITTAAATIEAPRRLLGREPRVYYGEVPYQIFGLFNGLPEGLRKALTAWKNEMTMADMSKIEVKTRQAIKGKAGGVARIPWRFLMSADEFFKVIVRESDIHGMAYRRAVGEGLKGEAKLNRITELIMNPDEAMSKHATGEALYKTFQQELGRAGKGVQRLREGWEPGRWIAPFVRTPVNIIKYGFERTPFNLPREMYRAIKGHYKGAEIPEQLSKPLVGSLISVALFIEAMKGNITGGGPTDRAERQTLYRTGWKPYSIRTGMIADKAKFLEKLGVIDPSHYAIIDKILSDKYVSYAGIEPIGTVAGVVADMAEIWKDISEGEREDLAGKCTWAAVENITNKTFLRGVFDILGAIKDPERYGQGWFNAVVGSIVPTGVAQVARAKDPYFRDVRSSLDAILARLPFASETLPPRRELYGEAIEREGSFWENLVSPFYKSTVKEDPVDMELIRLKKFPSMPQRKIEDIELTPKEYSDLMGVFGPIIHFTLTTLIKSEGYKGLSDDEKKDVIDTTMIQAGKVARAIYKGSHPEILEKWLKKWQKEEEKE